jgi:hypothetical protein
MQLKNHEWTLMNTNLRTRTMIQPFAPQSLNDRREFRRKGTPILWFHWCLFVFIGGLTASFRLSLSWLVFPFGVFGCSFRGSTSPSSFRIFPLSLATSCK